MTGTADTEAPEFKKIYNLDVVVMPTHQKMIRKDYADVIYKNLAAKDRAIIREIKERHEQGQPILVGTISIDISEKIAKMLKKEGIKHEVLNAKQHDREAEIIAMAGQRGRVTIATNMAGRGTDIKLGEGVREAGRTPYPRHQPAREPADRQPAARPLRPAGRPGLLPFLPLPGGRHPADLRLGPDLRDHGQARHGGGRAHRAQHDQPRPSKMPSARWKATISRSASTSWNTTTS